MNMQLRPLNGRTSGDRVFGIRQRARMIAGVIEFLERRVGEFAQANRSYLTIASDAPGQHRSVDIAAAARRHFERATRRS